MNNSKPPSAERMAPDLSDPLSRYESERDLKQIEDKIASKRWDLRASGFEELAESFKETSRMNSEQVIAMYSDHGVRWKKYLSDTNSGSLEKCLLALYSFLDHCPIESKCIHDNLTDIVQGLIEKCLCHLNEGVRVQAMVCFLKVFEVTSEFKQGINIIGQLLKNKTLKIV